MRMGRRAGGGTDEHDAANSLAFPNFTNDPKNETCILGPTNSKANKCGVQHTCYITYLESKVFLSLTGLVSNTRVVQQTSSTSPTFLEITMQIDVIRTSYVLKF
jgi:hypothetical protein